MLLDINKIKVNDRIRKDFGNIEELARDIEENGLINPPVVTPDYTLIAGERRLRACKHLGYSQIEVRVMTIRDYEHQLRMEISENENRKEFTFSERVEWARRLEEIERLKAKERMETGGVENFPQGQKGKVRDIVADQAGFGSGKQYEKAKFIAENADDETIRRLDEDEISIHKAYTELKKKLKQSEQAKEQAEKQAKLLQKELEKEKAKQPEIIEKEVVREVVPPEIEKKLKEDQLMISAMKQEYEAMAEKVRQLELMNVEDFDEKMMIAKQRKLEKEAEINVLELRVAMKQFLEKVPFTPFMRGAIAIANQAEKKRVQELTKGMRLFVEQVESALRSEIILKEANISK